MASAAWDESPYNPNYATMKSLVTGTAFNKAGQMTSLTAYGGSETRTYDANTLQLTGIQVPGALDLSYVYPAAPGNNGRITAETRTVSGISTTVSYTYDQLNRLSTATSVSGGNTHWGLSFSYDVYGNRTAQTVTAGGEGVPHFQVAVGNDNRMVGYSYDNNGNQLNTADGATLEYDEENRLKKWTKQGQTEEYRYHPSGWRLSNSNEGSYLYGPGGQLLTKSAARYTDHVYFAGRLLFTMGEGTFDPRLTKLTRMYSDRLGSTRATTVLTYGGGTTPRNYYPFGEEIGSTSNDQYKFASTYRDSATGLDYAVNRYYAGGMGRFLTPDYYTRSASTQSPQTFNRYNYAGNDPVNMTDPDGLYIRVPDPPPPDGLRGGDEIEGPRGEGEPVAVGGGGRYDKSALVDGATALLDSTPCTDFLADVGQKALLNIAGKSSVNDLSPNEQVLYFMLGDPKELIPTHLRPATFSDMGQPRTDQYGNEVSAEAEYGDGNIQNIALYNAFFAKSAKEQNQTILHEAMHLVFRFGDADLARAANVYKGDASASSDFQKKLSEKCK